MSFHKYNISFQSDWVGFLLGTLSWSELISLGFLSFQVLSMLCMLVQLYTVGHHHQQLWVFLLYMVFQANCSSCLGFLYIGTGITHRGPPAFVAKRYLLPLGRCNLALPKIWKNYLARFLDTKKEKRKQKYVSRFFKIKKI